MNGTTKGGKLNERPGVHIRAEPEKTRILES